MQTCPSFFDSISRRIKRGAKKYSAEEENECLIGAYISFFNSWKSSDLAHEDADELIRLFSVRCGTDFSEFPPLKQSA